MYTTLYSVTLKGRNHFGDIDVNGEEKLKWVLHILDGLVRIELDLSLGFCNHVNEVEIDLLLA
jgi:hypothetical protein